MTREEVQAPLKDLVKALNSTSEMFKNLQNELPNSMPKEEAEKLQKEINDLGVIERAEGLMNKLNSIK